MSDPIKEAVRQKYGDIARSAISGQASNCCCTSANCGCQGDYNMEEVSGLPLDLFQASLGCGNPIALGSLKEGEVVLDLGSGAGLDAMLAANKVGSQGKVYGLDMTDEMLVLARGYQERTGVTNVEFIKGEIENIPLPDETIDVVISNCVINLAADKGKVLGEAFRVLKPGGRLAISDMVWRQEVPARIRENLKLWADCIAGAIPETTYRQLLSDAGFFDIEFTVIREFDGADVPEAAIDKGEMLFQPGSLISAFISATKPSMER